MDVVEVTTVALDFHSPATNEIYPGGSVAVDYETFDPVTGIPNVDTPTSGDRNIMQDRTVHPFIDGSNNSLRE